MNISQPVTQHPSGNFLCMPRMLFGICIKICLRVPNFLERVYIQKSHCFTFYLSVNYSFLENQPEVTDQTLHALLYKQYFFFNSDSLCITISWIQLQVLLWCCSIHITTETNFVFSIFATMSRPRSFYVTSMRSVFHFKSHFHYNESRNLIKTDTLVCQFVKIISC